MKEDPIVEEIHRIREKLLAECEGDIGKLIDRLKAREASKTAQVISSLAESKAFKD